MPVGRVLLSASLFCFAMAPAMAAELELAPARIIETKAVVGRIEARDVIPARPRIGGTLVRLSVSEGDRIIEGQSIAMVIDDKLALQLRAAEARIRALGSEQANVQAEYERARTLLERGAGTQQRVDALRTQQDVIRNQITAAEADKAVIIQQASEGEVLAPVAGRVLKVPVTRGAVVMPGEQVALIAGGGFFLRLALPERHAAQLRMGAAVPITLEGGSRTEGKLVKIFPQIENGRVIADVELASIGDFFVGARVLAEVPVGERMALLVPKSAVTTRSGLDFITVLSPDGSRQVLVVLGQEQAGGRVEVLTGLQAGDRVVTP
ncbi:MAG: efflux RND transporter periplasmic adaptor subunit [Beijerinckiaceae bacterium]|nr:efflux RND transporter periplasmic adaptor subunit [Beijerinckiaceae bacterium]MCZ8300286.1 efflux RND transporter periplasmic adaptor subunit [Beijerinckiaceae bacterium]